MLETASEPTIEDYPVEAPDEAGPGQWACPVNFATEPDETTGARLQSEIDRLRPWSAETRQRRGRTLFGASGAKSDQVDDVAAALSTIAATGDVLAAPESDVEWAFAMPLLIRHLADDLRTFYHEAIAAQPGATAPNHDALNDWIFGGTALGETLLSIADHLGEVDGSRMALLVRGLLIPEGHYQGGSAFGPDR